MGNSVKVLIVEDTEDDAALLVRALQRGGYDLTYEIVETPEAMADALNRQEWDLAISDYSMPLFSGLDALKLLQEIDPDLSFILLTGQVGEDVAVEAMKAGARDYILKSNLARLIPAVERELRDTQARRKSRQNEQALQERRERYRLIVETTNEGIWQIDEDSRTTFVNQKMAEMLGYTIDEMLGQPPYVFMDEEWGKITKAGIRRHNGTRGQFENKFQCKEGTDLWTIVNASPIFRDDGSYAGAIGMHVNITKRKVAEAALQASEEQLRQIAGNMLDMVMQTDIAGIIQYASPSHKTALGYEPEDLLGKPVLNFVHPEDLGRAIAIAQEQPLSGRMEFRFHHADGHYVWLETVGKLLLDDDGMIKNYIFGGRDITERKRAEQELRGSEEKLSALYSSMADGLAIHEIIYDRSGKPIDYIITDVNPAFEKLTGFKQEESVGKRASVLYGTGEAPFLNIYSRVAFTREPASFEAPFPQLQKQFNISVFSPTEGMFATVFRDVSEKKQMEETLRVRETQMRIITDNMLDIIEQTDAQGLFQYVSPSCRSILGYAPEDLLGKSAFANIHPDDREKARSTYMGCAASRSAGSLEYRLRHADGHYLWAETIGRPLYDNQGNLSGAVLTTRVISKRRQAEEALRQSETKYRSLVENLNEVVYTINSEGCITYISPAVERFAGYRVEEIIGKPLMSYVHQDDLRGCLEIFRRSLRGQVESAEVRLLRKNGTFIYARSCNRVLAENGQVSLTGVLIDTTERRLAEEALRSAHQQLAQIIEFLPDATLVIDTNRRVIAWNKAIEEMTGIGKESIRGDYAYAVPFYGEPRPVLIDLVLGEDSSTALKYEYLEKTNTAIYAEAYAPCTYQGRGAWLWGIASPLVDDEGNIIGAIESFRDITEHKHTEDELKKHRDRLEELVAERTTDLLTANQELEIFMYSASHDLRAPLRSIQGFSQILLEDYADRLDKQGSEHLERLKASSQHMSKLIEDLLDLSRVTSAAVNRQQADLSAMAREIVADLIGEQPERRAHFDIQEGITAFGDPDMLNVMLQNLLDNAWKFTSKKTETVISFGIATHNGRQSYYVRDNGAGFDMVHAGKLFEAFKRLHSSKEFPGTGIGLASVKRIIRRHGGQIWAEGEVNKGATFYFILK